MIIKEEDKNEKWVENNILIPIESSKSYFDMCKYTLSKLSEEEIDMLVDTLLSKRKYSVSMIMHNEENILLKLNTDVELSNNVINLKVKDTGKVFKVLNKDFIKVGKKENKNR